MTLRPLQSQTSYYTVRRNSGSTKIYDLLLSVETSFLFLIKGPTSGVRQFQIWALPLICCVTFGKILTLSVPQFLHFPNRKNNNTSLTEILVTMIFGNPYKVLTTVPGT